MAILITGLIGAVLIYLGAITLDGSFKKWYLGPRTFPPQAIVYATIPTGLGFIEICIILALSPIMDFDTAQKMITLLVGPTFALGFVFAIWQPNWIKPYWVRWLEGNYKQEIYGLIAAAREDAEAWERRVATQAGLEEWAKEVAGEPQPKH